MSLHRSCFVMMPFKPELNYFFLYLKKHIEETHNIACIRGDNDVLTIPLLDKIKKYIENADVLIADCTGRNPNVFYELGIAHTLNKKVILISMDDITEAPSDIRHYEFIKCQLESHEDFLSKLDNALTNVFVEDYESLYEKALEILRELNKETDLHIDPIKKDLFIAKVMSNERKTPIPDFTDQLKLKYFVVPLIMDMSSNAGITTEKVTEWLTKN